MSFVILIDSTGELNKEARDQYRIDYCANRVSINGEEIVASLDYDQGYSVHDFYEVMRKGTRIFTTAVPATEFQAKFEEYASKGEDILYIGCSSALSASVNVGAKVAEEVMAKYPGRRIVAFDSLISCYGQAEMAIRASLMREEGKSLDEVLAWLTENRLKFNQFATVETLSYLKQAGRVKAGAAFFGNIFSVKPILISDIKGNNYAVRKDKGRKASLVDIASSGIEALEDVENATVYIGHADDEASAEFVKAEVLKLCTPKSIVIGPIGPIVGASVGPGTIGVFVYGKEVTACGE